MGIRQWLRDRVLGEESTSGDVPPNASLMHTMLGKDQERVRSLGEYNAESYPDELSQLIRRRAEVTQDLLKIDVASRDARIDAIPRLQLLLRKYPHPLVYETLLHAYIDDGRFDEARGVAFAANERRHECARSPYPEIRAETDSLRVWDPKEIDELQAEMEGPSAR